MATVIRGGAEGIKTDTFQLQHYGLFIYCWRARLLENQTQTESDFVWSGGCGNVNQWDLTAFHSHLQHCVPFPHPLSVTMWNFLMFIWSTPTKGNQFFARLHFSPPFGRLQKNTVWKYLVYANLAGLFYSLAFICFVSVWNLVIIWQVFDSLSCLLNTLCLVYMYMSVHSIFVSMRFRVPLTVHARMDENPVWPPISSFLIRYLISWDRFSPRGQTL